MWACYEKATTFGATVHLMTREVDAGPIVATLDESIPSGSSPEYFHKVGETAAKSLYKSTVEAIFETGLNPNGIKWSGIKKLRVDSKKMLDMEGLPEVEVVRRHFAFSDLTSD